MGLPYMVMVRDEKCIPVVRDFINKRMGTYMLKNVCGSAPTLDNLDRLLVTPVLADKSYISVVANVRQRMMNERRGYGLASLCTKIPKWLMEKIDERARAEGVSKSELVRRALIQYFVLSGY